MKGYCDWLPELKDLLDRLQDGDFVEPDRLRLNELLRAGGTAELLHHLPGRA